VSVVERLRAAGCVFAEDEARLLVAAATTPAELDALVDRRAAGVPLEHVLGWVQFCGLRVQVDPGVFVPRRRTELLVREALALAADRETAADATVVDLCCGCGAVGAALVAGMGGVQLYAVDIDLAAVACARRNLPGSDAHVYAGDLYEPLPAKLRGRIDLVVANAPYVPTEAIAMMPSEARLHEPLVALDGGTDGLDIQRRIVAAAPSWLAPGGHLLVETSEPQVAQSLETFVRHGLAPRVVRSEELAATVVVGTLT
jgi:release factor glutamine methyltransferase